MTNALDKDLRQVEGIETATNNLSRALAAPGLALVFLLGVGVWASDSAGAENRIRAAVARR